MLRSKSILVIAMIVLLDDFGVRGSEGESALNQPTGQPSTPSPIEYNRVNCPTAEELRGWFQPIHQVTASLREKNEEAHPLDCSQTLFSQDPAAAAAVLGPLPPSHFMWAPSHLWHQPLYFNDTTLERYGQSICPPAQPLLSAIQFYTTFPIIPYKLGLDHPYDAVSALGYYRPGSPTPAMRKHIPFEWDAATLEAAAWTGAIFLLP